MPRKQIRSAIEIAEYLKSKCIVDVVSSNNLKFAIRLIAGSESRTIEAYIHFLVDMGLASVEGNGYRIHPERIEELSIYA